jgi:hypothetical protein
VRFFGRYQHRAAALAVGVGLLAVGAAPASGSMTIGHAFDASGSDCPAGWELLNPPVGPGIPYTVPGNGTITSWAMDGSGVGGQRFQMKMFRKLGDPLRYQVVGHSAEETLIAQGGTAVNTFPAHIEVKQGDALGLHTITPSSRCARANVGIQTLFFVGSLGDGEVEHFGLDPGSELNIEATFAPDNSFSPAGQVKRNINRGTATLSFNVPNPGQLTASGKGAKVSSAEVTTAKSVGSGTATLTVTAKGSKRQTLDQTGRVTLNLKVTYTPTRGEPHAQGLKVKLLKKI